MLSGIWITVKHTCVDVTPFRFSFRHCVINSRCLREGGGRGFKSKRKSGQSDRGNFEILRGAGKILGNVGTCSASTARGEERESHLDGDLQGPRRREADAARQFPYNGRGFLFVSGASTGNRRGAPPRSPVQLEPPPSRNLDNRTIYGFVDLRGARIGRKVIPEVYRESVNWPFYGRYISSGAGRLYERRIWVNCVNFNRMKYVTRKNRRGSIALLPFAIF